MNSARIRSALPRSRCFGIAVARDRRAKITAPSGWVRLVGVRNMSMICDFIDMFEETCRWGRQDPFEGVMPILGMSVPRSGMARDVGRLTGSVLAQLTRRINADVEKACSFDSPKL